MHPLRVLLVVSLAIAAAVGWGFGALAVSAGRGEVESVVLAVAVFAVFLLPWSGVYLWAVRRASDLDELTMRTRQLVAGIDAPALADRTYHGELDDLGRAIAELRAQLNRQRVTYVEHRAAMDQIVASLGEGLLAVNGEGKVVFANGRVAEMFGVSGSLTGRSFLEVVRRQSLVGAFSRAFAGAASTDRITLGTDPDERRIEMRVFPVASSREIAAVALFIDMTTIERLQRIRKDFLDDFSHEVRTPLAGVRSAAETFEHGGLTAAQEEQLRHVMLRQLARIERLVNDLSELNRIESGELVLQRQAVSLRPLVEELASELRQRSGDRDVRIRIDGEALAVADPSRLQQIVNNLLDNAWKHGGGEIAVALSREEDQSVLRVSDRGEGIPPGELARIFNRFYRVDKSRSQNTPGLGLGLAITKHLVLAHGGSITAVNRAGGGATFEVRLPAG